MIIGGFIKTSLMDYPGKIAAVVFTSGCNFLCHYCHNYDLQCGVKKTIDSDYVLNYIREKSCYLDGVVITGGEPTVHRDLMDFVKSLKKTGALVKLDTNGTSPQIVKQLINETLVDYIAMDIKTDINTFDYSFVTGVPLSSRELYSIQKSIEIIINSNIEHEFRTTVCRNCIPLEKIQSIAELINGCQRYYLQKCQCHPKHRCVAYTTLELAEIKKSINKPFLYIRE